MSRGRHARPERVAQLVERDLVDLRALERVLEAADELRAVQWLTGLRVAEDEVAIVCVEGTFAQLAQRDGDPLGHRHRSSGAG